MSVRRPIITIIIVFLVATSDKNEFDVNSEIILTDWSIMAQFVIKIIIS